MSVIVIQARMGSTRLPGKVLRLLAGRPVLEWVIRAAQTASAARVVVATTTNSVDDDLTLVARAGGAEVVRGDEDDVLSRFLIAVEDDDDETAMVRLTADCPLLDPAIIRACVDAFEPMNVDYLSTISPRSLPRGLDVEVASVGALRRAAREANDGADRAHVTSYLYREPGRFRVAGLSFTPPADDLRVTLDTAQDAEAIEAIVDVLGDRPPSWHEVVDLLRQRPDIVAMNADVQQKAIRDE